MCSSLALVFLCVKKKQNLLTASQCVGPRTPRCAPEAWTSRMWRTWWIWTWQPGAKKNVAFRGIFWVQLEGRRCVTNGKELVDFVWLQGFSSRSRIFSCCLFLPGVIHKGKPVDGLASSTDSTAGLVIFSLNIENVPLDTTCLWEPLCLA